jgi:hypothetical protein
MTYIIHLRDGSQFEIKSTMALDKLEQHVRSLYEDNFVKLEAA